MRGIVGLAVALALGACAPSLKTQVAGSVLDYKDAETRVSDQMLVVNILRAKDGLPLHFSDLTNIHGSLQAGAQVGADFPFGPSLGADERDVSPQLSVQTAPSFDVSSLDTQEFTTGVMSQIDPKTIKYVLDLGIDYRVALLLFFSSIQIGNDAPIANAPFDQTLYCLGREGPVRIDAAAAVSRQQKCEKCVRAFFAYLNQINRFSSFYVNMYRELRPLGPPFGLVMRESLKNVAALDPAKYEFRKNDKGLYQLYAVSAQPKAALCFERTGSPASEQQVVARYANGGENANPPPSAGVSDVCARSEIVLPEPGSQTAEKNKAATSEQGVVLQVRSVYAIVKYLGEIQRFEETADSRAKDRCITLSGEGPRTCSDGNILFHAKKDADDAPLSVSFGDARYSLGGPDGCYEGAAVTRCDHSLETLSIMELLLNLNKSAKELRVTPSVEVLP